MHAQVLAKACKTAQSQAKKDNLESLYQGAFISATVGTTCKVSERSVLVCTALCVVRAYKCMYTCWIWHVGNLRERSMYCTMCSIGHCDTYVRIHVCT